MLGICLLCYDCVAQHSTVGCTEELDNEGLNTEGYVIGILSSMHILSMSKTDVSIIVTWSTQAVSEYFYIWLRDIDPIDFHPKTQERLFDLTSVDIDIQPVSVTLDTEGIRLQWPEEERVSLFSHALLQRYANKSALQDPAKIEHSSWKQGFTVQKFDAATVAKENNLLPLLTQLKKDGVVIVTQLEGEKGGERFGDLIGFKRETNFGVMFEVKNKVDPNNLAYTSISLPLHTDLSNQELPPGYQFLHCIVNNAEGGESVLADGFSICESLKQEDEQAFQLLSEHPMPFRFHDKSCDIRYRHNIIGLDDSGRLMQFIFNAHLADAPDCEGALNIEYYRAYQALMRKVRETEYRVELKLNAGEMMIFDNRRVLHGRNSFDPSTGDRHLRGYYIDRGEVDSKVRVLCANGQR